MATSAKKIVRPFGATMCILSLLINAYSCTDQVTHKVPYYNRPDFTPIWKISQHQKETLHHIDTFSFQDQDGHPFKNDQLKGKIYLANFFFTSCKSICPKMTGNIKRIYTHFSGQTEIAFVSYSVTPEIDSIPKLKEYALNNNIQTPQWHLVTGDVTKIYKLARQSYFVEEEPRLSKDSTEFLHTENLVLVDGEGHIRGLYNGTIPLEADRIINDIDLLQKEK